MCNDGAYNECLPYKMKASSSSENKHYRKGLTTFDYSFDKSRKHFFVFAEDAKDYLQSRNYKDWYSIGEFEISDHIAIEYSGLGVDYKNKKFPLLEIAIPYGGVEKEKRIKLCNILTPEEKEKFTKQYYNGNQQEANIFFDSYYRIRNLGYTGNLYDWNDSKIEEKYRNSYDLYQELWPEFIEAYCARLEDYNQRIYTVSKPNLEKREKVLRKCNLIK